MLMWRTHLLEKLRTLFLTLYLYRANIGRRSINKNLRRYCLVWCNCQQSWSNVKWNSTMKWSIYLCWTFSPRNTVKKKFPWLKHVIYRTLNENGKPFTATWRWSEIYFDGSTWQSSYNEVKTHTGKKGLYVSVSA